MTARKVTAKDGADAIAMLDSEKKARTPRLHLDATGATVLTPTVKKVTKAAPAKKTTMTSRLSAPLDLRPVKMTMADRVRQQFDIGASLTEASKATGADPAYTWDLAAKWQLATGRLVPRNGRAPKVAAVQGLRQSDVDDILKDEDTCLHCGEARVHVNHQLLPPTDAFHAFEESAS